MWSRIYFFRAVSFLLKLQTRFESHKSYLLQQELFGASPPPATGLKYIWFQNVFHKFSRKEVTSDAWANFRDLSWCLKKKSSVHLIPSPLAPPSPSFGSFLAIARKMSFTFSCKVESVAINRTPYELNNMVFWDCDPHTTLTAVLALVSMKRRLFSSA